MEFTCFWSNCHTHFWRSSCSWCCECERDAEAQQKMNLVDENPGASSTPHRGNQPETISAMVNTVGHENTSFGSSLRSPLVSARTACGRGNPGCSASIPIRPERGYTMSRHFRSGARMYGDLPRVSLKASPGTWSFSAISSAVSEMARSIRLRSWRPETSGRGFIYS